MVNIIEYDNKNVLVRCTDGRTYSGLVSWCARSIDIDEPDDVLAINEIGLLASEIESITVID